MSRKLLQVPQYRLLVKFFVRPDELPAVSRDGTVRHDPAVPALVCGDYGLSLRGPVLCIRRRVVYEYGLVKDYDGKTPRFQVRDAPFCVALPHSDLVCLCPADVDAPDRLGRHAQPAHYPPGACDVVFYAVLFAHVFP